MTISKLTAVGVLTATLVAGLAIGRFALPSKVIERDHIITTDREVETSIRAYVGHNETRTDTKTAYQIITRWEKDGAVTQTIAAATQESQTTKADVIESTSQVKEIAKTQEVIRERIVEAKKSDWILGARVGLDFDKRELVYGGDVSRRVLGPMFVGGWGERLPQSWAAGVGVKVLF